MDINKINFLSIILVAIIIFIVYLLTTKKKESFDTNIQNSQYDIPETNTQEENSESFNLEYLDRRKCIIAISNPGNNTYKGTQNTSLGTIQKNTNSTQPYQPFENNTENSKYETIYVYTGKNGGVSPDKVKSTVTNDVEFYPTWEIILQSCGENKESYLIKNVETNRFLGCGKIGNEAPKSIVYLTNEKSLNTNNLWDIQKVGENEYTIKSLNEGTFLYSTDTDNKYDFVTNAYQTPFKNSQFKEKPEYNDYGMVDTKKEAFNWFIAPLPPQNGSWRPTTHFIGNNYYTDPSAMTPCVPLSNNNKEIIYPWYQNTDQKYQCVKDLPLEAFYIKQSLKPVYNLGQVGMSPWGSCPGFINQKASWIWYVKGAEKSAPGGTGKIFVYIFENNINLTECNINCIADNQAIINVNNRNVGTQTGGWRTAGGTFSASLRPGKNIFSFTATNFGNSSNPAGLLVSVYNPYNKQLLFSTGDDGWGYTYGSNL